MPFIGRYCPLPGVFSVLKKIVYLGPEGTFSYFAALHYFGNSANYFPKFVLEDVFKAVRNREAELGVIPLENSLQVLLARAGYVFEISSIYPGRNFFVK